jgi:type IV secretion system protein VirD4
LNANYDGIILGLWKHKGKVLRVNTDSHIVTLAPTRSGKGVSAIIPNMLHYKGSCFIIDPKGENARISARRRRAMGQAVFVLDPWRLTGFRESSYNPLDALDPESPDLAEDAALIADTLVIVPEGSGDGAFWQEEARALLTGLILYVACCEPPESRHLLRVRELLTQSGEETTAFYEALTDETAANGLIARMANRMLQKSDRERSSVTSTAQSHTHFLDSPRMASVLSQSSLALSSLKTRPTTIYLVLPAERLQTHARWLRLMVSMSLTTLARTRHKPEKPVLFVLDEFAALGRLEAVESAMGLMAGYGVQLWPILQDISQLQGLYGEKWRNFFANAGMVQTFNVTEPHTAEIISNMLGVRTAVVRSASGGRGDGNQSSTNRSESFQATQRPLLFPDEVIRLPADQQLVFLRGLPPLKLHKLRYYNHPLCKGLFHEEKKVS